MSRDPLRTFRAPDDLWDEAKERAKERDEPVSAAIRRALRDYIKGDKKK